MYELFRHDIKTRQGGQWKVRDLDIIDIKVVCIFWLYQLWVRTFQRNLGIPKQLVFEHPLDIESWGQSQSKSPVGFCCDMFESMKFTMWNYSIPASQKGCKTQKFLRIQRTPRSNGLMRFQSTSKKNWAPAGKIRSLKDSAWYAKLSKPSLKSSTFWPQGIQTQVIMITWNFICLHQRTEVPRMWPVHGEYVILVWIFLHCCSVTDVMVWRRWPRGHPRRHHHRWDAWMFRRRRCVGNFRIIKRRQHFQNEGDYFFLVVFARDQFLWSNLWSMGWSCAQDMTASANLDDFGTFPTPTIQTHLEPPLDSEFWR